MSDKGNPLDRLTRPGGRQLADDESIPVLTERLTLPSLDLDISLPQPPPPVAAAVIVGPLPPPPSPPPPPPPFAAAQHAAVPAALMPALATPAASPLPSGLPSPRVATAGTPTPAADAVGTSALDTVAERPNAGSDPGRPMAAATAVDWLRVEQALRDAVYRELQPALADEAGRLLRERLIPAIERVALATTAELRQSFEVRLRELIARAIAAEIERQRSAR